jgi:hypothetical protein
MTLEEQMLKDLRKSSQQAILKMETEGGLTRFLEVEGREIADKVQQAMQQQRLKNSQMTLGKRDAAMLVLRAGEATYAKLIETVAKQLQ